MDDSKGDKFRKDYLIGWECEPVPIAVDDDIAYGSLNFEYISENVPGLAKSVDFESDEKFQQMEGCTCCSSEEDCSVEGSHGSCTCLLRFAPAYSADGRLVNVDPFNRAIRPLFECNSECTCSERCANRVVQHGVRVRLKVFRTQKKGYGVKTLQSIARNTFVCEYAGEILTSEEAKQRIASLSPQDTNYIMTVREHFARGRDVTYIDPTHRGNIGRFINHSCGPNLFMVPVKVDDLNPHVSLFALRDIEAGEELTYDYSGDTVDSDLVSSDAQTMTTPLLQVAQYPCYCESRVCRKYLPCSLNCDPD